MSDLDTLLGMGFDKSRAELAVKQSGGLEGAMNWLEKTQDTPIDELLEDEERTKIQAAALEDGQVASSIVCNDCGKMFRNQELAGFHAEKTGHDDFAESTEEIAPLTEEQKTAKLEELRQKMALKKAKKAIEDKEEQKRNEQIRQKSTKDSQDMKEDLQRKEQMKEAARKRQEKIDDLEAKKRIKAKIEADKEERRHKAEKAKAAKEGRAVPDTEPVPVVTPAASRPAATHTNARLRLQLDSGSVQKTLPAETTLFEVAQMLQTEHGVSATRLTTSFPRKVFEGVDFGKTLKEAGLVPSGVLIVK